MDEKSKRGRPKGSLNRRKTWNYHVDMMEKARRKLQRERGGRIYTPLEYWLLTMSDEDAEADRRDAAAHSLASYTYHKPAPEVADQSDGQQQTFGWAYPDAAQHDSIPAEAGAGQGARVN